MAVDLLGLLSTVPSFFFKQTVVGIYTSDAQQVLKKADLMDLDVQDVSELMEHPVETGVNIIDHRILMPVSIEISMLFDPRNKKNLYEELIQLRDNGFYLTIQTNVKIYPNQVIKDIKHKENAEMYGAIMVQVSFRQVEISNASFSTIAPLNPKALPTVIEGEISSKVVDPVKKSTVLKWFGG